LTLYEKQYQKPVKLIYKLPDARRIKIGVGTKLGHHHRWDQKKEVLKFLSVSNIVIAPAKTGRESKSRKAVIKTAQTNKGVLWAVIPGQRIFKIVTIKFIAPKIEEIPAKCKLKIAKSTAPPE
jgi:hypothetical protein